MRRQVVLDTETTGLEVEQGHQIIEIGCVELVDRRLTGRDFHHYLRPDREIEEGAEAVHGISNAFLADKPRFADIVDEFLGYVEGAELVIHNAPFDVGFINAEIHRLGRGLKRIDELCPIVDTLVMARRRHPGQRNSLDALCKRYGIDNSQRELHGALLDARILAEVYLAMTGGQVALSLAGDPLGEDGERIRRLPADRPRLRVIRATEDERRAHEARLAEIDAASGGRCLWRSLDLAD
ncbi:MAG TPA: DNA polymerase III subunit epsilon [Chromatiales bacterium]|nr:DNA polymerase III subunit epsilon [Chromatiales bacterium]